MLCIENMSIPGEKNEGWHYVYPIQSIHHRSFGYTGASANLSRSTRWLTDPIFSVFIAQCVPISIWKFS